LQDRRKRIPKTQVKQRCLEIGICGGRKRKITWGENGGPWRTIRSVKVPATILCGKKTSYPWFMFIAADREAEGGEKKNE